MDSIQTEPRTHLTGIISALQFSVQGDLSAKVLVFAVFADLPVVNKLQWLFTDWCYYATIRGQFPLVCNNNETCWAVY